MTRLESQRKMQDDISDIIAAFRLPRATSYEKLMEERWISVSLLRLRSGSL